MLKATAQRYHYGAQRLLVLLYLQTLDEAPKQRIITCSAKSRRTFGKYPCI